MNKENMNKEKIKIYSEKNVIPKYESNGASGFDLRALFTDKTCTTISRNNIRCIEHSLCYLDDEVKFVLNVMFNDFETNILSRYTLYESLKKAIRNKLEEINNDINDRSYTLYDYLLEENISKVNIILPFSHNVLPTGLYVELPKGTEIQIRPRSGIGAKTNMIAHFGTIDSDYRGNIGIIINNPSPYSFIIFEGERLAQGVFNKVEQCEFIQVDDKEILTKTERNEKGFGSTGK